MKECIILAGGFGTRLQHLIPDIPKCLAPVAGMPFLFYLMNYLCNESVEHFIFSVGYQHEKIIDFLDTNYPKLKISYAIESEALGTGGAIVYALKFVEGKQVFILNGDTYFPVSLTQMQLEAESTHADLIIAGKQLEHPNRYGTILVDSQNKIEAFREKQVIDSGIINGGIYLMNIHTFHQMNLLEKFSFEKDVLEINVSKWDMRLSLQDVFFIDIGVPEDYEKAQVLIPQVEKKEWTLFLDRDGVINELIPGDYVKSVDEFRFIPSSKSYLTDYSSSFKYVFVITNQQGIGKGIYTAKKLDQIHEHMVQEISDGGGTISKVYYCPHLVSEACNCRKPNPGMFLQAFQEFPDINQNKCVFIGDSESDMQASQNAGIRFIALKHEYNKAEIFLQKASFIISSLDELREKWIFISQ
ncbi:MAG: HAD-IIIA family hydrolase [Bacteroidota bacterium]|nr:HAD-IIIA family hydrolase [Bacteroidota bacterium]